ncbi:MAG TPA: cysteine desulfurase family protein [Methylomirabilota bacterium]|jgi:cysteine desulfurase|nr:cysteine desulfurase family protein [Methylomirabilota bacterium]
MRRVYLDHNASTPVHPEVLQAMLPYFGELYGNPSSIHGFGREARDAVELAREEIAGFLGVAKEEFVFTSGGTESDNLAIKGVAYARGAGHVISSPVEHHAVLRTCQTLERQGYAVTYVPVDGQGRVDPDDVRRAVRPDTVLITIMYANSEVGTIMPIAEIGRIAAEHGIPFHVDGVQAFGKIPFSVRDCGISLLSCSSHKIYGPKGLGGLYIRKGTKMVSIQHGGDHERRRRAGTENVPAIVGFARAVALRARDMQEEALRVRRLRDRLWEGVEAKAPDVRLNGHPVHRLPGTVNMSFRGIEAESLILALDLKGIGASAGSACTSGSLEPSYVLTAMGVPPEWALGALRCSLGRSTSEEDIDYVLEVLPAAADRLRALSPATVA